MKKLLLLLPLLLTPAAHAVENFNYGIGYRHCIRDFYRDMTREKWIGLSDRQKNSFRARAHRACN